jgi:hypothetical protein
MKLREARQTCLYQYPSLSYLPAARSRCSAQRKRGSVTTRKPTKPPTREGGPQVPIYLYASRAVSLELDCLISAIKRRKSQFYTLRGRFFADFETNQGVSVGVSRRGVSVALDPTKHDEQGFLWCEWAIKLDSG